MGGWPCLEASSCISACILCLLLLLLSLNLTIFSGCFASTRLLRPNFPIPIKNPALRYPESYSPLLFLSPPLSSKLQCCSISSECSYSQGKLLTLLTIVVDEFSCFSYCSRWRSSYYLSSASHMLVCMMSCFLD